jgi:hypothetical protein
MHPPAFRAGPSDAYMLIRMLEGCGFAVTYPAIFH